MTFSVLGRLFVGAIALACLSGLAHADGFAAVQHAALTEGVPVRLALAVARTESSGNCGASSGLAHGVMQVRPATAREVGITGNLFDCRTGAIAGVRYLRKALRAAGGSWSAAAHLYNAGVAARPRHTRYTALVMSRAR